MHVHRRRRAIGLDLGAQLRGVLRREQLRDRIVHEIGIAEIGVAVGVGEPFRFGYVVQRLRVVPAPLRERIGRNDVEDLAERYAAGAWRRGAR